MKKDLIKLYKDRRELTLLEITYFAIAIVAFGVAGILALFNQDLGLRALIVPLVAFIAGLMNIVVWAVIRLIVDTLVEKDKDSKTSKE